MQEKSIHFGNNIGLMNSDFERGVIFYSGFFGDKDESHGLFSDFVPLLHEQGFSTLRFDMSGLGESDKDLSDVTFHNWQNDSYQAIDYFHESGINQIGIVGFSLGAAYAILNYLRNEKIKPKIKGLALWAPAFNPRTDMLSRYKQNGDYEKSQNDLLYKSGKKVSPRTLDSLDFDVFGNLENVDCPILICHSEKDPYISLSTSQSVQKRIHCLDELLVLQNSGHSFRSLEKPPGNSPRISVYDRTLKFFKKYFH